MEGEAVPVAEDVRGEVPSLFEGDLDFAATAFEEVLDADPGITPPDFHPNLPSLTFVAPDDLRRRCEFLPREAVPPQWEFLLTTDRDRVQKAIGEARKLAKEGESAWPRDQLLWELHPMMQWLLDKVVCRYDRHAAPVVIASKLGSGVVVYLFEGVLSNKRSQPVVVEWFGVRRSADGSTGVEGFEELLAETGFRAGLPNKGDESVLLEVAQENLVAAVEHAEKHMLSLCAQRTASMQERIDEDRERFAAWHRRSKEQIELIKERRKLPTGKLPRNVAEMCERLERDVEHRRRKRREWVENTLETVGTPYLKLAAVFAGE